MFLLKSKMELLGIKTSALRFAERPALTAGELLDGMQDFNGKGAGAQRKRN